MDIRNRKKTKRTLELLLNKNREQIIDNGEKVEIFDASLVLVFTLNVIRFNKLILMRRSYRKNRLKLFR